MKNILSAYKHYRNSGGTMEVRRPEFCKILNAFNKHIVKLVQDGHTVKLPERLGSLYIKGTETKPKYDEDLNRIVDAPIDFGETNKLWATCPECKEKKQMLYHLNEHTDGVAYRYVWSKEKIMVANKAFYTMIVTRANKRELARLIKEEDKTYYVEHKNQF